MVLLWWRLRLDERRKIRLLWPNGEDAATDATWVLCQLTDSYDARKQEMIQEAAVKHEEEKVSASNLFTHSHLIYSSQGQHLKQRGTGQECVNDRLPKTAVGCQCDTVGVLVMI